MKKILSANGSECEYIGRTFVDVAVGEEDEYEHCRVVDVVKSDSFNGVYFSITTIRNVQRSHQKMQWSKLYVQSFRHGKREDPTSFGTLKIDIFKVVGCGD